MKIKLEAINNVLINRGYTKPVFEVKEGEVIEAKINNFGISLLLNNCWTMDYKISTIEEDFKVWNQECDKSVKNIEELEVENEYLKSREWILENKIRELKEELRNIDMKY